MSRYETRYDVLHNGSPTEADRAGHSGNVRVDQRSCLIAMKKTGYSGYIDIEYEGDEYAPEVAVRKAAKYLRELIAEIQATMD